MLRISVTDWTMGIFGLLATCYSLVTADGVYPVGKHDLFRPQRSPGFNTSSARCDDGLRPMRAFERMKNVRETQLT